MTDEHRTRDFAISSGWVLVMVVPLCIIVLWFAIDHSNDNRDAVQHRANQQFAKALIVTDRKFHQALDVTTQQFAYAINKSVCGFRGLATDVKKRAVATLNDATSTASAKARARQAIRQTDALLATQVAVPSGFNCARLSKNPPTPGGEP